MKTTGKLLNMDIDYTTRKPKVTILLDTKSFENIDKLREKSLDVNIKQHREARSNDANKYFHLLVNKLARYYNLSDEEMKIKMNLDYGTIARFEDGRIKGCKLPAGTNPKEFYKYSKWYKTDENGDDCYIFYKETHILNTKEMSNLINGVVQECEDVGIETKSQAEIQSMLKEWDRK